VGFDTVVGVPTQGPVVAVLADVHVTAQIDGDVVAVAGNVYLEPGAVVRGDAVALGGRVLGGGPVSGSSVAVELLERQPGGRSFWGTVCFRAGIWLVIAGLLLLTAPGVARRAAASLGVGPWRAGLLGAAGLALWMLVAVLVLAVTSSPLGVAVLMLAIIGFLLTKAVGVVAVAIVMAHRLAPALPASLRGEVSRTSLVLAGLVLISFVPVAGPAVWLVCQVMGIGSVMATVLQGRPLPLLLPRLAR
jgi:hypothetical protein